MSLLEDTGELEIVSTSRGFKIKRWKAYERGEPLPLVCAVLPIIGTDKIVELLRSPKKRVMGGEWIFFLSEHQKASDTSARAALERGFREEVRYALEDKTFFDSRERRALSYQSTNCQNPLRWKAQIYVVPIKDLSALTPDGNEILDVRTRHINEVMHDVYKKNSSYKGFSPESFLKALEQHTRRVIKSYH